MQIIILDYKPTQISFTEGYGPSRPICHHVTGPANNNNWGGPPNAAQPAALVSGPGPPPGIRPRSKSRSRAAAVNTNNGLSTIWPDRSGVWLPM